jgi:hypothetical protein
MSTESQLPRPSVGDPMIVVRNKTRHIEEQIIPVRVRAVARFRVVLEDPDGGDLPWTYATFDLRNGYPWSNSRSDRISGLRPDYTLYTEETLAWSRRAGAADRYLLDNRIRRYEFGPSLRKAYDADPVGFVNTLRRFEGLEEI